MQSSKAEGFDFETASSKVGPDGRKTFSLHKFIDQKTHKQLKKMVGNVEKGTIEHAWNMKELKKLAKEQPQAKVVYEHLNTYFANYKSVYSDERIVTFPLKVYHSDAVANFFQTNPPNTADIPKEGIAKLALEAKFDDFWAGPVSAQPDTPWDILGSE